MEQFLSSIEFKNGGIVVVGSLCVIYHMPLFSTQHSSPSSVILSSSCAPLIGLLWSFCCSSCSVLFLSSPQPFITIHVISWSTQKVVFSTWQFRSKTCRLLSVYDSTYLLWIVSKTCQLLSV